MDKIKLFEQFLEAINKSFKKLIDSLYIIDDIKSLNKNQKILLHISDTPETIYPFIFKVIDRLEPDYIIHTGDLVDNVKIAAGESLQLYEKGLKKLINELEKLEKPQIYIIPGNHDSKELIDKYVESIHILKEGSEISIEDVSIGIAHYKERLAADSILNLYGHDKSLQGNYESSGKKKIYLNGLLNVNIIILPNLEIHELSYPLQTDSARKYKILKLP
ncbi:MAG: metallophosphoesterase family protein [Halanaerobiales bacterium]